MTLILHDFALISHKLLGIWFWRTITYGDTVVGETIGAQEDSGSSFTNRALIVDFL